jgi:hypothetical protein
LLLPELVTTPAELEAFDGDDLIARSGLTDDKPEDWVVAVGSEQLGDWVESDPRKPLPINQRAKPVFVGRG